MPELFDNEEGIEEVQWKASRRGYAEREVRVRAAPAPGPQSMRRPQPAFEEEINAGLPGMIVDEDVTQEDGLHDIGDIPAHGRVWSPHRRRRCVNILKSFPDAK